MITSQDTRTDSNCSHDFFLCNSIHPSSMLDNFFLCVFASLPALRSKCQSSFEAFSGCLKSNSDLFSKCQKYKAAFEECARNEVCVYRGCCWFFVVDHVAFFFPHETMYTCPLEFLAFKQLRESACDCLVPAAVLFIFFLFRHFHVLIVCCFCCARMRVSQFFSSKHFFCLFED